MTEGDAVAAAQARLWADYQNLRILGYTVERETQFNEHVDALIAAVRAEQPSEAEVFAAKESIVQNIKERGATNPMLIARLALEAGARAARGVH